MKQRTIVIMAIWIFFGGIMSIAIVLFINYKSNRRLVSHKCEVVFTNGDREITILENDYVLKPNGCLYDQWNSRLRATGVRYYNELKP